MHGWPISVIAEANCPDTAGYGPGRRLQLVAGLRCAVETGHPADRAYFTVSHMVLSRAGEPEAIGRLPVGFATWPWSLRFAAMHLAWEDGEPLNLHLRAQALAGISTRPRPPDIDALARFLRIGRCRAEALLVVTMPDGPGIYVPDRFTAALEALRPEWQAQADRAVALLLEHGAADNRSTTAQEGTT
jgi:hypothetical protein